MKRAQYVALYEIDGKKILRFIYLEYPDGMIPPPEIRLGKPLESVHTYTYAEDQSAIAAMYGVSQQAVSRWSRMS